MKQYIVTFIKTVTLGLLAGLIAIPSSVYALSPLQKQLLDSGSSYFNVDKTSAACVGNSALTGADNAEQVFNFFVGKGLQPFQAAGIIGNMTVESGIEPQRLQGTGSGAITPAESFSGGLGWGIVQWTPGSKMIDTFTPKSRANDLAVQLDFLWEQLEGRGPLPEKRAGDDVKATTTLEDAVLAFQGNKKVGGNYFGFERPADQAGSVSLRTGYARDALSRFGSGPSVPPTTGGCGESGAAIPARECPKAPVEESQTVIAGGLRVHPCIAPEVERIVALAGTQGMKLAGSGWASRTVQEQKRINNGCAGRVYDKSCTGSPRTAVPGTSRHEFGTAIDFTCNGTLIGSRSSQCFVFLSKNTTLKNLDIEPYHWSNDGG